MDRQTDGRTDGRADGRTDGQADRNPKDIIFGPGRYLLETLGNSVNRPIRRLEIVVTNYRHKSFSGGLFPFSDAFSADTRLA